MALVIKVKEPPVRSGGKRGKGKRGRGKRRTGNAPLPSAIAQWARWAHAHTHRYTARTNKHTPHTLKAHGPFAITLWSAELPASSQAKTKKQGSKGGI